MSLLMDALRSPEPAATRADESDPLAASLAPPEAQWSLAPIAPITPIEPSAEENTESRHLNDAEQFGRTATGAGSSLVHTTRPRGASKTRLAVLSVALSGVIAAGAGAHYSLRAADSGWVADARSTLATRFVPSALPVPIEVAPLRDPMAGVEADAQAQPGAYRRAGLPSPFVPEKPPAMLRLSAQSAFPASMLDESGALRDDAPASGVVPASHVHTTAARAHTPSALAADAEPIEGKVQDAHSATATVEAAEVARASLRVTRTEPLALLDGKLRQAWDAFMRGELDAARQTYLDVLARDGMNRDALLGMAALEAARGATPDAAAYYRRLLARDPRDGDALVGFAALGGGSEPGDERRLRALARDAALSGHAHFLLGNLYARQTRWAEAQQAYFEAFGRDPGNPDFAFNLAVSLEHLGQDRPALDYYRRALELARERAHGFGMEQALQRIETLQGRGGE